MMRSMSFSDRYCPPELGVDKLVRRVSNMIDYYHGNRSIVRTCPISITGKVHISSSMYLANALAALFRLIEV